MESNKKGVEKTVAETIAELRARVRGTTARWNCLVKNAEELAVAHKNHDHGKVYEILLSCGVTPEDMDYYMKALMDCRMGRSW